MNPPDFVSMPKALPNKTLADVERAYILEVLDATRGNKLEAARILGVNPTTIWRKLKKDKALRTGAVAAYLKPAVPVSPLLYAPPKKVTPKRKPIPTARKEEISQYIEEIYDSLHTP